MESSWSPRRKSLPGLRRPIGSTTPTITRLPDRPDTVPVKGSGKWRVFSHVGAAGGVYRGMGDDCFGDEWIKASWRKGECRQEIKMVAAASGLAFDDARIVALRLYNHFHWLPQLHERAERLQILVGKERRLSLSVVRQKQAGFAGQLVSRDYHKQKDDAFCRSADPRRANQCDFHGYVRGLCFLCQAGTYDQVLDFLFRVYSTAREERVIGRAELAAILENHVVYDDFEDPNAEKERVYRWLKRQFIELAATTSSVESENRHTNSVSKTQEIDDSAIPTAAINREAQRQRPPGDGGGGGGGGRGLDFVSWEDARALLRRGPHGLEDALAIDLPRLSKDLWAADLADGQRTTTFAVEEREGRH